MLSTQESIKHTSMMQKKERACVHLSHSYNKKCSGERKIEIMATSTHAFSNLTCDDGKWRYLPSIQYYFAQISSWWLVSSFYIQKNLLIDLMNNRTHLCKGHGPGFPLHELSWRSNGINWLFINKIYMHVSSSKCNVFNDL